MKKLFIYAFIVINCFFISCEPNYKKVLTTIEMQKVNGEWITKQYMLPESATFYISERRGSYSLMYECPRKWYNPVYYSYGTLKNAVIDFKYYKPKPTEKSNGK